MSLPSHLVEHNDVGFKECFLIDHCPYCWLGFSPMWVRKIASCKHVYQYWCVVHFNISSKWIHPSYAEEMHELWWSWVGIPKLETLMIVELKSKPLKSKLSKCYILSPKSIGFFLKPCLNIVFQQFRCNMHGH